MKKSILLFGVLSLMAINIFAQENAIKINPLSAVVATGNIAYERAVGEKQSFQLGLFYTGFKVSSTKFSGFGITPEYRFYLGENVLDAFYAAPFVRYQNLTVKETETDSKATLSTIGGGVVFGRQWILGDAFTIDIFLGPSYSSGSLKLSSGAEETDFGGLGNFQGFGLRTGITLGLAF